MLNRFHGWMIAMMRRVPENLIEFVSFVIFSYEKGTRWPGHPSGGQLGALNLLGRWKTYVLVVLLILRKPAFVEGASGVVFGERSE